VSQFQNASVRAGRAPRGIGYDAIVLAVGVLAATFDPVHFGDLHLASEVRRKLDLDWVLLACAEEPATRAGRSGAPVGDRRAMILLAAAETPWLAVSATRIVRPDLEGLIGGGAALRAEVPDDAALVLIVGPELLRELERRPGAEELLGAATLVVAAVPGRAPEVPERLCGRVSTVEVEAAGSLAAEVSSRLARGDDATELLPKAVASYVRARGLYGAGE
jgi:nicotinic acid mononucleotide adenylyltransferase